jgi:hypothetical protein
VPLFIDRLPFVSWTDQTRTPPRTHWSVVLPVLVSEPGLPGPPPNAPLLYWALDTGHRGAALAWRRHLLDAGLDPDVQRVRGGVNITTALGGRTPVPVRLADLWLVSNVPALAGAVWRLELDPGVAFNDVMALPDPNFNRPLIGLRTLRTAQLRVEIDFNASTVSVWTPDPQAP